MSDLETQSQEEPNPYKDIRYFSESRKFRVMIPNPNRSRTNCPVFNTLQEAMAACDKMYARNGKP